MQPQRAAAPQQLANRRSLTAANAGGLRHPFSGPLARASRRQHCCTVFSYNKEAVNGVTKRGSGAAVKPNGKYSTAPSLRGSLKSAIEQQRVPPSEVGLINIFNLLATPLSFIVGTPWYRVLEAVLLTVQLAVVDAAYSGDWVRIGAISTDTEALLQKVVWVIVSLHALCAVAAATLAEQRGKDVVKAGFKGLLFGTLAIYEVTSPKMQDQA